mgnify:FL=1
MSAPKGGNRLQKKSSGQKHWTLILFMVPGLVYLLINNYIPMAGILLAFKKVNYTLGIFKSPWCGLSNFKYLFKTKDAAIIFRNTVLYNLAFIVLGTAAAVATAILLGEVKKKKLLKIYQTSILLPHILSTAVIAYLAIACLSKDSGFLNNGIIKPLGGEAISWYSKPKYWPFILTFIQLWRSVGYTTIMYYATLVGIDTSYYEAAVIDGASTWDQIRYITLPCLKTTIITLTIMNLGRMFYSDFGLFYQVPMNNGLLFNATNTLDTYVYRGLLELNDIGRASAACFIQSVLGFVLVWGANALTRKVDPDSAVF